VSALVQVSIGSKTIGGAPVTKVSFVVQDGDVIIDEDGSANTTIVDPIGPAIPIPVSV
jgi:hypothetical protein